MKDSEFLKARADARRLAAGNLREAAANLLVWHRTGRLPGDGTLFHGIAALLEPHCLADDSMQEAEKLVTGLCILQAAGEEILLRSPS